MHPSIAIGSTEKKLPETVSFYNNTKYGVDVIDQMARQYTTRAGSRRWLFYNILDLALINAWILYKESTGQKISRHQYVRPNNYEHYTALRKIHLTLHLYKLNQNILLGKDISVRWDKTVKVTKQWTNAKIA